jgi:hypothetical protein
MHVWPSPSAVDAALDVLRAYRDQVRDIARRSDSDDPRRDLTVAVWGSLGDIEQQMRALLTQPVPARGETTEGWRRGDYPMPRNRGPV